MHHHGKRNPAYDRVFIVCLIPIGAYSWYLFYRSFDCSVPVNHRVKVIYCSVPIVIQKEMKPETPTRNLGRRLSGFAVVGLAT
jgi:hypothetical protein